MIFTLVITLSIVLAIIYPDRTIGTRPCPDLPGPRGWPLIGNLFLIFLNRSRMIRFLHEMQEAYGPLYTFTLPYWGRIIVVNRPEWLEHIKRRDTVSYTKGRVVQDVFSQFPGPNTPVATEGASWRRARKRMQPLFSTNSIHNHASHTIREFAPVIQNFLKDASRKGTVFDWNDFCARFTITVFCKMAFSLHLDVITSDVTCLDIPNVIGGAIWTLNQITNARLFNPLWRITQFLDGTYWKFSAAKKHLSGIIRRMVSERLSVGKKYGDYLDALLLEGKKQDIKEIHDMLMVLFLAGRDSTLGTFVWTTYELCRNPEWITSLRSEIETMRTENDIICFKEAEKYHLHRAVLFETLRLWPGLPKNARVAMEDDVLPSIDASNFPAVHISKGDFVLWSDYSTMRDREVWGSDAEKYNPARHLDSNGVFIAPKAPKFHGFGFGPRSCPGEPLSTYEFISILSLIVQDFDIVPVQPGERALVEALTSFMEGPFFVTVKPRGGTILS